MAKVNFNKLGLNKELITSTCPININGQDVEIKQYLPVNEKLKLITNVINNAQDGNPFYNPVKIEMFSMINLIEFYTNITFTEKQKEDPCKLYDLLESNKIFQQIINAIPKEEYDTIIEGIEETIHAIYNYQNSVMGILDAIKEDYSNLDLDATAIQNKLNDPENIALLRDIMAKLG